MAVPLQSNSDVYSLPPHKFLTFLCPKCRNPLSGTVGVRILFEQGDQSNMGVLVQKSAPNFQAQAVIDASGAVGTEDNIVIG